MERKMDAWCLRTRMDHFPAPRMHLSYDKAAVLAVCQSPPSCQARRDGMHQPLLFLRQAIRKGILNHMTCKPVLGQLLYLRFQCVDHTALLARGAELKQMLKHEVAKAVPAQGWSLAKNFVKQGSGLFGGTMLHQALHDTAPKAVARRGSTMPQ
mmetsp:Transcript_19548/g.52112  ORF Transcript_19548/g.52112 Transcript_19548/m.52112 type:complete len:154 (-) Transcript_19548:1032-1493(-)